MGRTFQFGTGSVHVMPECASLLKFISFKVTYFFLILILLRLMAGSTVTVQCSINIEHICSLLQITVLDRKPKSMTVAEDFRPTAMATLYSGGSLRIFLRSWVNFFF